MYKNIQAINTFNHNFAIKAIIAIVKDKDFVTIIAEAKPKSTAILMLEFASDLLLFAYISISMLIILKIFGTSQYEYSISLAYFQTLRLSHLDFSFESISHLIMTY